MENLVNCEDCGKSVSRRALACPNCGSPIQEQNLNKETIEEKEPVKELAIVTLKKYVEPVYVESNLEKAFSWLPAVIVGLFLIYLMAAQGFSVSSISVLMAVTAVTLLIPPAKKEISEHFSINKHILLGISSILVLFFMIAFVPEPSPETVAARKAETASQKETKSVANDTSKAMLAMRCELAIKPQLKNPKSMNVDFSATRRYSTNKGFNLEMSYYAENSFGATMINKALCEFNESGTLINVTSLE